MHAVLALLTVLCGGPTIEQIDAARKELRPLLDAMAIVESNNNDNAIGDHGKALGALQIWEVYWRDAVEYAPDLGGRYEDVTNRDYAERVVVAYMLRYAHKAIDRKDFAHLARVHNGGPKGYKVKATLVYYSKILKHLQ